MKESKSNRKRRCLAEGQTNSRSAAEIGGYDNHNSNSKTHARRKSGRHGNNPIQVSNLPWEITCNTLSRLPIKALIRFMGVSKSWSSVKQDPYFIDMQLKRALCQSPKFLTETSSLFYNPRSNLCLVEKGKKNLEATKFAVTDELQGKELIIVGTCNGLLCLFCKSHGSLGPMIIVYNPVTGDSTDMKFPVSYESDGGCSISFGFDATSRKYKVVVIHPSECSVISVGESCWRKLSSPERSRYITESTTEYRNSVFVNGVFCWITVNDMPAADKKCNLAMNIFTEKFEEIGFINKYRRIPLCPCCSHGPKLRDHLVKLQKSIGLIVYNSDAATMDIWRLDDSKTGTWSHESTHNMLSFLPLQYKSLGCNCIVEGMISDSEILLEYSHKVLSGRYKAERRSYLARYTPGSRSFEFGFLKNMSGIPQSFDVVSFVPSLVNPILNLGV